MLNEFKNIIGLYKTNKKCVHFTLIYKIPYTIFILGTHTLS